MFSKRQKQNLERKLVVHFPRRTLINEKRKSNKKESTTSTQSILSMKVKTKSKLMSLLNANEKCSFEPTSK
jgi:predicted nuclease of restriction endonuclease-like (RecB) superfamily